MTDWTVSGDFVRAPGPGDTTSARFYEALFRRVAGVDVSHRHTTEELEVPRDERRVKGYCGNERVGYRWSEVTPLESSMFPSIVEEETYGLPGIDLRWRYRLAQDGQAGRSKFQHDHLDAGFANDEARAVFATVWTEVFGTEPKLEPRKTR
jgi:hypothetical protein